MPLNAGPVVISDVLGTTAAGTVTVPVGPGDRNSGSERTAAGKRVQLDIIRTDTGGAAVVGNIAVFGADLPNPLTGKPLGNAYATTQTETAQVFTPDGSTTSFATSLIVPAAVSPLVAKDNIVVETAAFKVTGSAFAASAAGVITLTGGDALGATAAMVPALPELEVGDVVSIVGTVSGVVGVTVSGVITAVASATSATWDQTTVITSGTAMVNLTQTKRFKLVLASGAAGPRAVNMATAAGSAATVAFVVAPPAQPVGASTPGVIVYAITPTEILAAGAHMVEKLGIRARSILWTYFSGIQTAANRTLVAVSHLVD